MRFFPLRLLYAVLPPLTLVLALPGCHSQVASPDNQVGPDVVLPAPHNYLLPPMKIATPTPWENGQAPTAGAGLKVQAFATGLIHPRSVFTLPNGDVLVAETDGPHPPVNRPKDYIMGVIKGSAGKGPKAPNDIILLRDSHHAGVADQRFTFMTHRHSPFGMALIGNDLYVADTDAVIRFHYTPGQTTMTDLSPPSSARAGRSLGIHSASGLAAARRFSSSSP